MKKLNSYHWISAMFLFLGLFFMFMGDISGGELWRYFVGVFWLILGSLAFIRGELFDVKIEIIKELKK